MSSSKIIDLFKTMDYNNTVTPIDDDIPKCMSKLLASNENRKNPCYNDIKKNQSTILQNIEKARFINNLADKFESEKSTFITLERKIRYFNKKDAETAVEQFIANLRYYSAHFSKLESNTELCRACIIVHDDSPLSYLGSILGNILVTGNCIVFNPTGKLILAVVYFIEATIKELRFQNNVFIYYGKDVVQMLPINKIIIYCCGDLDIKFDILMKPIIWKYPDGKIPMLVFNNADLDSASYSVIQAVWGFQGTVPWCVDKILVQEDVFDDFVILLKEKLLKVKIPEDISVPKLCESYADQFKSLVSEAKARNINFWMNSNENFEFTPLIVIGDVLMENNVIEQRPKYSIPFATILPFRNTAEAVALANNSRQGLAASVWTENIGLVNEVSRKLQVGTVWVNAHGQFRPDVSFVHQKSGYALGCMNGIEAIQQSEYRFRMNHLLTEFGTADFSEDLSKLKTAQGKWSKLCAHARKLQLVKLGLIIENNINDFVTKTGLSIPELKLWIDLLIKEEVTSGNTICDEAGDIKSYREPIGLIVLVLINETPVKLITSTIANGNSLMLLTYKATGFSKMVKEMEKHLPGIVKSVDGFTGKCFYEMYKSNYINVILTDRNINVFSYYNMDKPLIPLQDLNDDYKHLTSKVKNVWYNFGDSFS